MISARHSFICCLLLGIFLNACDVINPSEPTPSYLYIEDFEFTTSGGQGSASEKITEVWVFIDDSFLGAFATPALVPVLNTGSVEVRLEAGIKENGLRSTPDIYPFYTTFSQTVELSTNEVDTLQPQISYKSNAKFPFVEDFERSSSIFQTVVTGTAQSRLKIARSDVFEGTGSGLIELSTTDPFVEIATSPRFSGLLDGGNSVFLEVNYLSDVPVSFGVIAYERGSATATGINYQAGFNANEDWNKIYFNLTPVVFNAEGEDFQVVLRAALPIGQDNTFEIEEAKVLLDNIKLVHF